MLKIIVTGTLLTLSALSAQENYTQEGMKYIQILGSELKNNLQREIKADPTGFKAMEFCSNKAEKLTQNINKKLPRDVSVKRTALKYRNEANKPDGIDEATMLTIVQNIKDGKADALDPITVELDGRVRVYKPLVMEPLCLKCHGSKEQISPQITQVLKKKYPNDMATGFKEGDFRGVIVAQKIQ